MAKQAFWNRFESEWKGAATALSPFALQAGVAQEATRLDVAYRRGSLRTQASPSHVVTADAEAGPYMVNQPWDGGLFGSNYPLAVTRHSIVSAEGIEYGDGWTRGGGIIGSPASVVWENSQVRPSWLVDCYYEYYEDPPHELFHLPDQGCEIYCVLQPFVVTAQGNIYGPAAFSEKLNLKIWENVRLRFTHNGGQCRYRALVLSHNRSDGRWHPLAYTGHWYGTGMWDGPFDDYEYPEITTPTYTLEAPSPTTTAELCDDHAIDSSSFASGIDGTTHDYILRWKNAFGTILIDVGTFIDATDLDAVDLGVYEDVVMCGGRAFWLDTDGRLYYSRVGDPLAVRDGQEVDISGLQGVPRCLATIAGTMVAVFSDTSCVRIMNAHLEEYDFFAMEAIPIGCSTKFGWSKLPDDRIVVANTTGLFVWDGRSAPQRIDHHIRNVWTEGVGESFPVDPKVLYDVAADEVLMAWDCNEIFVDIESGLATLNDEADTKVGVANLILADRVQSCYIVNDMTVTPTSTPTPTGPTPTGPTPTGPTPTGSGATPTAEGDYALYVWRDYSLDSLAFGCWTTRMEHFGSPESLKALSRLLVTARGTGALEVEVFADGWTQGKITVPFLSHHRTISRDVPADVDGSYNPIQVFKSLSLRLKIPHTLTVDEVRVRVAEVGEMGLDPEVDPAPTA